MDLWRSDKVCKPDDALRATGIDGVAAPAGDLDLLNGLEVRMPSACSKCGCVTAHIQTEAKRRSLRCASCRTHLGWVSYAAERFLQKVVERFGRPTKVIEIHSNRPIELSPPPSGAGTTTSSILAPTEERYSL